MDEEWKPVARERFSDLYEVSTHGRVKSKDRFVRRRGGGMALQPGRVLTPWGSGEDRRPAVTLVDADGRKCKVKVHILVLESHVGARPDGLLGLHKDGDVLNPHVSNLYWGTYSDNLHDSVRHGTHHDAAKTECPKGHPLDGVRHRRDGSVRQRYCTTCDADWQAEKKRRQRLGIKGPVGRPRLL
jgi:hypothetical protein